MASSCAWSPKIFIYASHTLPWVSSNTWQVVLEGLSFLMFFLVPACLSSLVGVRECSRKLSVLQRLPSAIIQRAWFFTQDCLSFQ